MSAREQASWLKSKRSKEMKWIRFEAFMSRNETHYRHDDKSVRISV